MADAPTPEPLTPAWWLDRLWTQLLNRQTQFDLMDAYYTGYHPLPFLTKAHDAKMRDEFRILLEDSRTNFMRLVVEAVEERLQVNGFRLSASADPIADQASWDIWQANHLDADSSTAFTEALVKGVSYLSVWAPEKDGDHPTIAIEDACETIIGYVPGSNFRQRAAALKVWTDDWTGHRRADVYMPEGIYKYEAPADDSNDNTTTLGERPTWTEIEDEFVRNPIGIVPIVALRNRPRLLCEGESELSDLYRVQNQINGFTFLLALAGYFGAHKQRWAVGLRIMEDKNGKPIEPFDVSVDKLWQTENPNAKFGEFTQTDLDGYQSSIDQKTTQIAILAKIPKHYLNPSGQEPSGDAIASAEAGLIKKAEKKQSHYGQGLKEAMNLARMFANGSPASIDGAIIWADPQTESIAVVTDAVLKQFSGGLIPWEAALEKLGYSQTDIARFAGMRMSDVLLRGLTEPENPDVDWKGAVDA